MEPPYPLQQKPDSTFGFTFLVDAYKSSHMLAMPQTLGPVRLVLADLNSPRGSLSSLATAGTLLEGFSTGRYQPA